MSPHKSEENGAKSRIHLCAPLHHQPPTIKSLVFIIASNCFSICKTFLVI